MVNTEIIAQVCQESKKEPIIEHLKMDYKGLKY